jgi:hypothetical protein
MKTEVYSWRVSTDLKASLERAARRRNLSLAAVLDTAAQEWLMNSGSEEDDDEKQRRLMQAASECIGSIAGDNPRRSETAGETVRQILRRRHGR